MKLWNRLIIFGICFLLFSVHINKVDAASATTNNGKVDVASATTNNGKVDATSVTTDTTTEQNPYVIVENPFVISISYGFSQEARYGRYVNLSVDIYNKGDTFQGTIEATLLNLDEDNYTYAKEVSVGGMEKSQFTIPLPMNSFTKEINFKLVSSHEKTLVEEIIPLSVKNYGDSCMIGVLSDNPIQLSYFQYFGNRLVNLNKDNLSSDYMAYDMLDTIVVDHFDLDSLESDKLDSLLHFVEQGGSLVLGISDHDQSNIELLEQYGVLQTEEGFSYTDNDNLSLKFNLLSEDDFTRLLTEIRGYESNRNEIVNLLEENKSEREIDETSYIGDSMLGNRSISDLVTEEKTKLVTMFSLKNSTNTISKGGIPLYDRVEYGNGNIMVYHFCLQNTAITEDKLVLYNGCKDELFSTFYAEIIFLMKENLSKFKTQELDNESTSNQLDYRLKEMSEYTEMNSIPKVGRYIVILLIYILLIAPVSFLFLWKKKQQKRIWAIIPVISVIFFGIMYFAGTKTRIRNPYIGYLNIEYTDDDLLSTSGVSYVSLGLNEKGPATIKLGNADSMKIGSNNYPTYYAGVYEEKRKDKKFYDYTKDSIRVTYQNDGIQLDLYDEPVFSTKILSSEYKKQYSPIVTSDLVLTSDSFTGSIENCSNQTFHDTLIYLNGYYINLGTVQPGDVVKLSDCTGEYAGELDSLLYMDGKIAKEFGINRETISERQNQMMNAYNYIYECYLYGKDEPCLIATLSGVPAESAFYNLSRANESYGCSMIVNRLNINDSGNIVPNMDCYLKNSSQYTWDEKMRLSFINSIEFQYELPKSERMTELFLSDLFNSYDDTYANQCSRVYLYDYSVSKYELVFDLDSQYGTKSIGGEYLYKFINENNEIRIKYETRNPGQEVFYVPMLSCKKEAVNVKDQ